STISNYDAAMTYIFTPSGPSAGAGGVISGMAAGTTYTATANDGSCSSAPSAPFSNAPQLASPAIPVISSTPPTCTSDGSSTISNYDAAMTYIFTPSGPSAGAGGVISGMAAGTTYTAAANDGSCSSAPSAPFSNAPQLPVPVATITGLLTYCTGGTTTLTASGGTGYVWMDSAGNTISNNDSIIVTEGTYIVEVTNSSSCSDTASASVTELSNLTVIISGAMNYCPGANTTLTATGGTSYSWSNGSITDSITVTQGTYTVTAADAGCSGTASAVVTELVPAPINLGSDVTACEDSLVILDAGSGYTNYVWSNGDTTRFMQPPTTGTYSVTAADANGCTVSGSVNVAFDECITITIPSAFSPNGDGINDIFRVRSENITEFSMAIFNRWGEKVFETNNINDGWDGYYKNEKAEIGVYAYYASINNRIYKGSITLIR
ncbi:MAG TPA: gliding motility-associated C-terminal domain-containing protein, partial [Chitinophagales bacterium]|nr:gliding motility-associated C-terminal domain-containing protein [Chitinophagales bacterium]